MARRGRAERRALAHTILLGALVGAVAAGCTSGKTGRTEDKTHVTGETHETGETPTTGEAPLTGEAGATSETDAIGEMGAAGDTGEAGESPDAGAAEAPPPAAARDRLFALIRGLGELPVLEPATVGGFLWRQPELLEVYAHTQEIYGFAPGKDDPNRDIIGPAELRWMPGSHKGFLRVEVAPDLAISMIDIIVAFQDLGGGVPILPDPRNPKPTYTRAYPVAIGELRFTFPEDEDEAPLKAFAVDQNPLVPWPKKPGTG